VHTGVYFQGGIPYNPYPFLWSLKNEKKYKKLWQSMTEDWWEISRVNTNKTKSISRVRVD
jgi:hypothetical protein